MAEQARVVLASIAGEAAPVLHIRGGDVRGDEEPGRVHTVMWGLVPSTFAGIVGAVVKHGVHESHRAAARVPSASGDAARDPRRGVPVSDARQRQI